uniref:Endonuclease/exonuclease/phosphatase domain-containing protein n=1 Tax=Gouania willdenowi TaxID=441366 RepID=A0A8C5NFP0_GOUWI
ALTTHIYMCGLHLLLSDLSAEYLIIGGDFNQALNTSLDRSSKCPHTKPFRFAKVLMDYMEDLGIRDVWILNNPTKKEYTFFSPVHKSFSQTSFFQTVPSRIRFPLKYIL